MTAVDNLRTDYLKFPNTELDDLVIEKLEKYAAILEKKLVDKKTLSGSNGTQPDHMTEDLSFLTGKSQ